MGNILLKNILDDEFLGELAKSADLYKIGSNSVLDPDEIFIGFNVVPRAVMSLMLSELAPMEMNASNTIHLPFGKDAFMNVNKNAADDYTGSIYDDGKLVYSFQNRSIPGLALILLSTFELYDLEQLKDKGHHDEDTDRKVQRLIDERMELHSLVGRVVEEKIAQREAIHKLMMDKLNEALKDRAINHAKMASNPPIATNPVAIPPIATNSVAIPADGRGVGPIEVKPSDITKKEAAPKKGSPLKGFLERKKAPKEYHVEMTKSETVDCDSCGQTIFGKSGFSGCICYGQDRNRKIWIKKSDDVVELRFSRGWDPDNIEQLLETLRKNNGRH